MPPNPQLSPDQRDEAHKLLAEIRERIRRLAGDDPGLVFAYRRKIYKELNYDERGKPAKRKRLKRQLTKASDGKCRSCGELLPPRGSVLDRREAIDGYNAANVDLICRSCDAKRQGSKGFT
jgi:hypothetical protein